MHRIPSVVPFLPPSRPTTSSQAAGLDPWSWFIAQEPYPFHSASLQYFKIIASVVIAGPGVVSGFANAGMRETPG